MALIGKLSSQSEKIGATCCGLLNSVISKQNKLKVTIYRRCMISLTRPEETHITTGSSSKGGKDEKSKIGITLRETAAVGGICSHYANALLDVADQKGKVGLVAQDVASVSELYRDSIDFQIFLETPAVNAEQKAAVLGEVASRFGMQEITSRCLQLLAVHRRLPMFVDFLKSFDTLLARREGIVRCTVTTVQKLEKTQEKEVLDAIKTKIGPEAKLVVDYKISQSILGGIIIQLGDQILDYSLRSRLETMKKQLLSPLDL